MSRLSQLSSAALGVLHKIATDDTSPASSRVSAAKTILEMAIKTHELEDIVKRLDELEQIAEGKK